MGQVPAMAQVTIWCDALATCLGCGRQFTGSDFPSRCCGQGLRSEMKVFSMRETPETSKRWWVHSQINKWATQAGTDVTRSC